MTEEQFRKCLEYIEYSALLNQIRRLYPWYSRKIGPHEYHHFVTPEYFFRLVRIGHSYYYKKYSTPSGMFEWEPPIK